jgi:hypothetical protein
MSSNVFKTYPYPVLGNNDDISGVFQLDIEPEISGDEVEIKIELSLDHPDIEKMLNDGYAGFSVYVACKRTLYKNSTQTSERNLSIKIPSAGLRDRVDVTGYIIATKNIDDYRPCGVRADMDLGSVPIEAGDIIADAGVKWFIADKYFDPLKSPVSSFIKIMKSGTEDGTYTVDFDNHAITIKVPSTQFEYFEYVNTHKNGVLVHAPIVLPVLVEAIIKLNEDDYADYSWAEKLRSMLDQKNLDQFRPFATSQELLGLPIKRNVAAIKHIISASGEDDE